MSWKISSSKSYPWKKSSKQTSRLRTSPAAAPGLPFASAWRSPRIWRPWRRCKSARRWGRPWRRRSWRSCWGPGAPVGPREIKIWLWVNTYTFWVGWTSILTQLWIGVNKRYQGFDPSPYEWDMLQDIFFYEDFMEIFMGYELLDYFLFNWWK